MKEDTLIILGNGFDINIGWKTSYKDFLTSEKFSVNGGPRYCMQYTNMLFERMYENWYDLEGFMRECVEGATEESLDSLNMFWQICRNKIYDYFTLKDDKWHNRFCTDKTSCAYLFLQKISKSSIFSFNYTNPYIMTQMLQHEITHMHGSLEDGLSWKDIKLGIDLHVKNKFAWNEKLLPYLKAYGSEKIDKLFESFKHADNIVIYGHSLGITDSDYFEPIFSNIIDGTMPNKSLFFVTKNSSTMQNIKDNLMSFGIDYNKLIIASKKCKSIYTCNGSNNSDFQELLTII